MVGTRSRKQEQRCQQIIRFSQITIAITRGEFIDSSTFSFGRTLCITSTNKSKQFIADNIESNEMFKDQRMAQELVMEALKYHLLPERRPLLQTGRTKPRKATVGTLLAVGGMDANKGNLLYAK